MASVAGYNMKEVKRYWDGTVVTDSEKGRSGTSDVEEVSTSITQTWTDQAIKCYLSNADCANCSIPRGNYSFTCQMNKVVPVLLDTLGEPDTNRVNKLLPYLPQY